MPSLARRPRPTASSTSAKRYARAFPKRLSPPFPASLTVTLPPHFLLLLLLTYPPLQTKLADDNVCVFVSTVDGETAVPHEIDTAREVGAAYYRKVVRIDGTLSFSTTLHSAY